MRMAFFQENIRIFEKMWQKIGLFVPFTWLVDEITPEFTTLRVKAGRIFFKGKGDRNQGSVINNYPLFPFHELSPQKAKVQTATV